MPKKRETKDSSITKIIIFLIILSFVVYFFGATKTASISNISNQTPTNSDVNTENLNF